MTTENPYSARDLHGAWDEGYKAADADNRAEIEDLESDVAGLENELDEARSQLRDKPALDADQLNATICDLGHAIRTGNEADQRSEFRALYALLERAGYSFQAFAP